MAQPRFEPATPVDTNAGVEIQPVGSYALWVFVNLKAWADIERQTEMAVGPAGTVKDTNVPPQNNAGVSPKQVEEFKEAVNRSTASNDASGIQSSKGKHSQDTSKSLPIILATRPPINRGNPIGKQGTPLPLATSKHETRGILGELDPKYDAEAWDNDEGSYDVQNVASNFQQVEDIAARIANSQKPVTDADRTEWMQAQQKLRQTVTDYAGEISKLPPDSPDRAAAKAEMARLSDKLTAQELPVLARFDKGFGES